MITESFKSCVNKVKAKVPATTFFIASIVVILKTGFNILVNVALYFQKSPKSPKK
jgi:hypothetical protein